MAIVSLTLLNSMMAWGDHSVYVPSQWEMVLHCNAISYWLGAYTESGIILCMRPANERWRYTVTPSLIGWAHTQNDPRAWDCNYDREWGVLWLQPALWRVHYLIQCILEIRCFSSRHAIFERHYKPLHVLVQTIFITHNFKVCQIWQNSVK